MSEFEKLLQENLVPLQRYVKFKISNKHDAEDIIQEVCLTATVKFESIKNVSAFKAWLIGIAHNKCNDYYRQKAKNMDISLESLSESALSTGRFGITEQSIVRDTLDVIGDKEKQILYLYFFKNHSQEDIAKHHRISAADLSKLPDLDMARLPSTDTYLTEGAELDELTLPCDRSVETSTVGWMPEILELH